MEDSRLPTAQTGGYKARETWLVGSRGPLMRARRARRWPAWVKARAALGTWRPNGSAAVLIRACRLFAQSHWNRMTPLFLAAVHGLSGVVNVLLDGGADNVLRDVSFAMSDCDSPPQPIDIVQCVASPEFLEQANLAPSTPVLTEDVEVSGARRRPPRDEAMLRAAALTRPLAKRSVPVRRSRSM